MVSLVDYNEDGMLSFSEFSDLIDAFDNKLATSKVQKKEGLFKAADKNGDGVVSMDELAALLAFQQEKEPLLNCCPFCGEVLQISDQLNNMIQLTVILTKGLETSWFFKLSEWAHFSSYDVGVRSGSSASHILRIENGNSNAEASLTNWPKKEAILVNRSFPLEALNLIFQKVKVYLTDSARIVLHLKSSLHLLCYLQVKVGGRK